MRNSHWQEKLLLQRIWPCFPLHQSKAFEPTGDRDKRCLQDHWTKGFNIYYCISILTSPCHSCSILRQLLLVTSSLLWALSAYSFIFSNPAGRYCVWCQHPSPDPGKPTPNLLLILCGWIISWRSRVIPTHLQGERNTESFLSKLDWPVVAVGFPGIAWVLWRDERENNVDL